MLLLSTFCSMIIMHQWNGTELFSPFSHLSLRISSTLASCARALALSIQFTYFVNELLRRGKKSTVPKPNHKILIYLYLYENCWLIDRPFSSICMYNRQSVCWISITNSKIIFNFNDFFFSSAWILPSRWLWRWLNVFFFFFFFFAFSPKTLYFSNCAMYVITFLHP